MEPGALVQNIKSISLIDEIDGLESDQSKAKALEGFFVNALKASAGLQKLITETALKMYETSLWVELRNEEGKPYASFEEWLRGACRQADVSNAMASTMNSFLRSAIALVEGGAKGASAQPITFEQIASVGAEKQGVLAPAFRRTERADMPEEEKMKRSAILLEAASNPSVTAQDLRDKVREVGASRTDYVKPTCSVVYNPNGGAILFIETTTPLQLASVMMALKGRVEERVGFYDDLLDTIYALRDDGHETI